MRKCWIGFEFKEEGDVLSVVCECGGCDLADVIDGDAIEGVVGG